MYNILDDMLAYSRSLWSVFFLLCTMAVSYYVGIRYVNPGFTKILNLTPDTTTLIHASLLWVPYVSYLLIGLNMCLLINLFKKLKSYKEKGLIWGFIMGLIWGLGGLLGGLMGFSGSLFIMGLIWGLAGFIWGLMGFSGSLFIMGLVASLALGLIWGLASLALGLIAGFIMALILGLLDEFRQKPISW